MRELRSRKAPHEAFRYTLRGSNLVAWMRHGDTDAWILEEIFCDGCYVIPEAARESLHGLSRHPRVLDLGAHVGLFGLFVLSQFPDAEITAVEPDPSNLQLLEKCARDNRPSQWRIVEACAAVADGTADFISCKPPFGNFAQSHIADSPRSGIVRVPARDVIAFLEGADLVKIDIQGAEWQILENPRFSRVSPRIVVLEYHPRLCPTADPRGLATELLMAAGYEVRSTIEASAGEGTLWAWKV
jgi:FkbM family methyltransferase